jgi:cystathionine beta-synthase
MRENGFLESAWIEIRASDVLAGKTVQTLYTAQPTDRQNDVIALMKQHDISQLPVVDEQGQVSGIVTEVELLDHMLTAGHTHDAAETIEALVRTEVATAAPDTLLESLMTTFTTRRVVLIVEDEQLIGIITKIDLLDYLAGHMK